MQRTREQYNHLQNRPAPKQGKGMTLESPQSNRIAQFESMTKISPPVERLAQLAAMTHNSPAMVAQRRRLNGLFSGAIQRVEEETSLQGKFETAQSKKEESHTGTHDKGCGCSSCRA